MTRARECEGKRRYDNRPKALAALLALCRARGTNLGRMAVYQCKHCSVRNDAGWHIGHRVRRRHNH